MSSLLEVPHGRRTSPPGVEPLPSPTVAGVLAAAQAAGASLIVVLAPVVATWVVSAGGRATWRQAVQLGLTFWLLAQHVGVSVPGGHLGFAPLGLALVPIMACWYSGRRLARAVDPAAERIAAGASRARPSAPPIRALVAFVATYCCLAGLGSVLAVMPSARPITGQAVLSGALLAGLAGGCGAAAHRFGGAAAGVLGILRALWLPAAGLRCLRAALAALSVHLGAAAILLAVMLVAGRAQVLALHQALDPGLLGGAVLTFGQVMIVPNLLIWCAAVLAGPGFAVGSGTSVTAGASVLGPLPAVPVLGALPAPGPLPPAVSLLLVVPILAGALCGVLVLLAPGERAWWEHARDATVAAVIAGVLFGAAAWASGGPAGPGRLAVTGPAPLPAGGAFALEVAAGALVTVLAHAALPAAGRLLRGRYRLWS